MSNWSNSEYSSCRDNSWFSYNNGWVDSNGAMWLLTLYPMSGEAIILNSFSNLSSTKQTSRYGVYPTLYLNSSVKIVGGTGSSTDPYILSM